MNERPDLITRLAPGDGKAVFEASALFEKARVTDMKTGDVVETAKMRRITDKNYEVSGLENGTDYKISIVLENGVESYSHPFRCGEFPGTVISYIHPMDKAYLPSGMCPATPCILRSGKRLIVSHDIFYRDMAQNLTLVFYSEDEGVTWSRLSSIEGCLWGKMFIYQNTLFMLGSIHEYGDLNLYESGDGGKTWEKACTVLKGGNKYTGGPHKSAMPVVEHDGRIWISLEYGSWELGGHSFGVMSASGDIRKSENWIVSGFIDYNPDWPGVPKAESSGCIEGNVVLCPDGKLIDFLRFGFKDNQRSFKTALYTVIDYKNPDATPVYGGTVDFYGSHTKFCIKYDESTDRYWTISNKADSEKPGRRNELILMSSKDVMNWQIEQTLLDYEHNGWSENHEQVGFQYVDFIFNGDEIEYVSRTALNGALNYHDSNCITFHKVKYR